MRPTDASSPSKHSFRLPAINNLLRFVDQLRSMLGQILFGGRDDDPMNHMMRLQPLRLERSLRGFDCPLLRDYRHCAGLGLMYAVISLVHPDLHNLGGSKLELASGYTTFASSLFCTAIFQIAHVRAN
jgi:hypothetical protein